MSAVKIKAEKLSERKLESQRGLHSVINKVCKYVRPQPSLLREETDAIDFAVLRVCCYDKGEGLVGERLLLNI